MKLNKGHMPDTDFYYEEFEGLLGSFLITLFPLLDSEDENDKKDFFEAKNVLNGFADRYGVQRPLAAIAHPRPTKEKWGQPRAIKSCWGTIDLMSSFINSFSVGVKPGTTDFTERCRLGQVILGTFDRRGIIEAEFGMNSRGEKIPTSIKGWNKDKERQPFS